MPTTPPNQPDQTTINVRPSPSRPARPRRSEAEAVRDVANREDDRQPDPAILAMTNEMLVAEKWISPKTGNLFSVSCVETMPDGRRVIYRKPGRTDGYRITLTSFAARFRPVTKDELWNEMAEALAVVPGTDGEVEVGLFVEPDARHQFDRMVLYPETVECLRIGMNKVVRRDELEAVWGISAIEPRANRCVLNLYGPPGTGKTMAAMSVAATLGKRVYQVDYSQIISKFVGDTAKHIRLAFKRATDEGAVLFFDEADSLVSKRISGSDSNASFATSINQNRNVLMQELDRFDGVVIMSTNLFKNFDEAILRRIAQHVPFRLPNLAMRKALFALHVPRSERFVVDDAGWTEIAGMCKGFSGGDVLNAVVNAINRGSLSPDQAAWKVTTVDLKVEAARIAEAKLHHRGNKPVRMGPRAVTPAIGTDAAAGPESVPQVVVPASDELPTD